MFKKIDKWMCLHWPRYKFRRICKALRIRPGRWLREFVFYDPVHLISDRERTVSKTTAVMVRLLMQNPADQFCADNILYANPDFREDRMWWFNDEWRRVQHLCMMADIPVILFDLFNLRKKYI